METVVYVVYLALMIYGWLIVARALLSWFPLRPGTVLSSVYGVLFRLTEPYLAFFRRLLPVGRFGSIGIDWSFPVALAVLFVAIQVIVRI
jgi:YggT family protein